MDDDLHAEARALLVRMALLSYGSVAALERRRGGERERIGPPGESVPMCDEWAAIFDAAPDDASLRLSLDAARAEYNAHVRRQLAPDTTETWDELATRIVTDGWGISAGECAMAMRCTPSLVRRARLEQMRHPDTGYQLPEPEADLLAWARRLDAVGLSVRQIEALTKMPKSTLHYRLSRDRN